MIFYVIKIYICVNYFSITPNSQNIDLLKKKLQKYKKKIQKYNQQNLLQVAIRGSGYSETASNEVIAALGVLAKYGVLGVGVGLPHANGAAHQAAAAAHNAAVSAGYLGALEQSAAAANNVSLEQYFLNHHNSAAAALSAAAASKSFWLQ